MTSASTSRRSFLATAASLAIPALNAQDAKSAACAPCDDPLRGFTLQSFTWKDRPHPIYTIGNGPPVVVLHELGGLSCEDLNLARMLAADGYTALTPLLFGEPGESRAKYQVLRVCAVDQFDCNGANRTPPVVDWLREFVRSIPKTWKEGEGTGVIGMGLTGLFPLAMLDVERVKAPIVCQPTPPFSGSSYLVRWSGLGKSKTLGLPPKVFEDGRDKTSQPILAIRYHGDHLCPPEKFKALFGYFGQRFNRLDLEGKHHSSLADDMCPEAYDEVRAFLAKQLKGTGTFPVRAVASADPPSTRIKCSASTCNAR